ncbi:MAG TPA: iron-sulfur cluster assembly accessory protein [Blastocatellia bacterium]|jgi:iron-sulfur cluster assembly protein|nr:iron-sulfur cluster assembly accessory protein [Blastocatellia bacterium]
MAIELTRVAVEKIREIMNEQGLSEGGLRVGVKGGGCSGLGYTLALDTEERPGDKVFEMDGVKVFVDMKSYLYLNGTTLDYKMEGLMQRGFTFVNPNSAGDCGCGESFAV